MSNKISLNKLAVGGNNMNTQIEVALRFDEAFCTSLIRSNTVASIPN